MYPLPILADRTAPGSGDFIQTPAFDAHWLTLFATFELHLEWLPLHRLPLLELIRGQHLCLLFLPSLRSLPSFSIASWKLPLAFWTISRRSLSRSSAMAWISFSARRSV